MSAIPKKAMRAEPPHNLCTLSTGASAARSFSGRVPKKGPSAQQTPPRADGHASAGRSPRGRAGRADTAVRPGARAHARAL